jgi:hypothetical protein
VGCPVRRLLRRRGGRPIHVSDRVPNVAAALADVEDLGMTDLTWQEVPDQLPGCQDDWLGPVRIYRDESGAKGFHRWQRLVDGEWVEFEGPTGGYSLQIV